MIAMLLMVGVIDSSLHARVCFHLRCMSRYAGPADFFLQSLVLLLLLFLQEWLPT
jgi:hypothetical protein